MEHNPALVFILAGQSNMAGRAPGSELPAEARGNLPSARLDYVCSFGEEAVAGPPNRSEAWVSVTPQPQHWNTMGAHCGPEIGLAYGLATRFPGRRIYLIKHGRGATNLAVDWDPDARLGRHLYQDFLSQVRRALARLETQKEYFRLAGLAWAQGEADATHADWAAKYGANLDYLVARIRHDVGASLLPVVIIRTGKSDPRLKFVDAVRTAQEHFVDSDSCAALLSTDDAGLMDACHYDAAGQWMIGLRLAEKFAAEIPG